ncbi:molybdate ABC transporter substrate-binding protein [Mycolicibacterium madagascariense]|uniref:molybdate ABC transporter substrate-binding protein n=1 Tax=Mycolicibacterium madagascariense TaxID=212765 RepID=UPI0013D5E012|nr:molybdate ABC transporter substrate-binding protein [Mycolicibacterium madagascariense]MCV7014306.1 molybdate ABC transporter substrate-binding protein [Mycolicibacterium madagascariense]
MTRIRGLACAVSVILLAALTACGSTSSSGSSSTTAPAGGSLTVYAAASLKKSFTDLGQQFSKDNPGWKVDFTFAGSLDLVTQLTQGAKADVFASADTKNMHKAGAAGLLSGAPVNFASNTLVIVTPPGNPKKIASFADLATPGLDVVVCAPQVPCGSATKTVEQATKVTLNPVSEESQVTDVLTKVTTGQADAGLVYVTDALGAAGKVTEVDFPESAAAVNTYPIAVLKTTTNADEAKKFIDLVTGPAGQQTLSQAGFAKP